MTQTLAAAGRHLRLACSPITSAVCGFIAGLLDRATGAVEKVERFDPFGCDDSRLQDLARQIAAERANPFADVCHCANTERTCHWCAPRGWAGLPRAEH